MEKTFVKAGMFRSIFAVITVLSLLAACSGVIPDDEITQAEQAAIRENGAAIRIPITTASASRATATTIGFTASDSALIADYYEAYLKSTATATLNYVGSAQAGAESLLISVLPGTYKVLVLAGAGANGDAFTGEKVLLGTGYAASVSATQGKVTSVPITLMALTFTPTITGVPKGATAAPPAAGTAVSVEYDNTVGTGAPYYAQFASAAPTNYWTNADLKVSVAIANLANIKTWADTTITAWGTTTARILTRETQHYAIPPYAFGNTTIPTPVNTSPSSFVFTLGKANIPAYDAVGVFSFDIAVPELAAGTTHAQWHIRNRLLRNAENYYGGGIAFLFGNVGTAWVQVIPTFP